MTARALGLDRFLLSCLHNKSFTAEIAENLSVGRQLWWLGKDDNFQDIIGGLIYFTCGHRKQSLSTEYITKMRFSRSSRRSSQLLSRVNRHNQSWAFIEWERKMRKNKPRTTLLSVSITGCDRAQEHNNTKQFWWREAEKGQNRRQSPVALVHSLNIPSETRTMSGIWTFKNKVFFLLKNGLMD